MGHVLLGTLPRTRKWQQVVALIAGGAGTAQLASACILAAEKGFELAGKDHGVLEAVWLLMQLPLAARTDNFVESLRQCGLDVSDAPGLMEIASAVSAAVDARMPNCAGRSDLGEMAQMAVVETIMEVVGARVQNLFGTTPGDVHRAFHELATVKNFGLFAKDFFGRFTYKCVSYFLSKALSHHVGEGQRFATLKQQAEFSEAMATHCKEAAKIVQDYAGDWFSKHNWETDGNITRKDIADFTSYAMWKLTQELKQGARHAA